MAKKKKSMKPKKLLSKNGSKLNVHAFAISAGLTLAILLFTLGLITSNLGKGIVMVETLSAICPGYAITAPGLLFGAVWGFIYGILFGTVFSHLYNSQPK